VIPIIVLKGKGLAHTLASLQFKYYGERINNIKIILCDSWSAGFESVANNYKYGLFVKSGTVFKDIQLFLENLNNYPHRGGIGHLVDPKDPAQYYYLDDQCFLLELDLFNIDDFTHGVLEATNAKRSEQNIHHDYTPLTLQRATGTKKYNNVKFGSRLISKLLSKTGLFVNWNNTARDNKQYLYNESQHDKWIEFNKDYINLATNQFWIFNNENWEIVNNDTITSPASGLFWVFNIIKNASCVNLVDISKTQIQFAQHLWESWNGDDYGSFVYNFIKSNQIEHFNLGELTQRSKLETLKLSNQKYFVPEVNRLFDEALIKYNIENFENLWNNAKQTKTINFFNDNIINWVLVNQPIGYVWKTNVDSYKYTLLHSTYEDINEFTKAIT
jgi:hypothetical protein